MIKTGNDSRRRTLFIEAKNTGKRSASLLLNRDSVNVARTCKNTKQASNKVDTE